MKITVAITVEDEVEGSVDEHRRTETSMARGETGHLPAGTLLALCLLAALRGAAEGLAVPTLALALRDAMAQDEPPTGNTPEEIALWNAAIAYIDAERARIAKMPQGAGEWHI